MAIFRPSEYLQEQSFIQMPRSITQCDLSVHAKYLYTLLLDRGKLSEENGFLDEDGVYVFCTLEHAAEWLGCSRRKVQNVFDELTEAKLIRKVRRGVAMSNLYYLCPLCETGSETKPKTEQAAPAPQPSKAVSLPENNKTYRSLDNDDVNAVYQNLRIPESPWAKSTHQHGQDLPTIVSRNCPSDEQDLPIKMGTNFPHDGQDLHTNKNNLINNNINKNDLNNSAQNASFSFLEQLRAVPAPMRKLKLKQHIAYMDRLANGESQDALDQELQQWLNKL